MCIYATSHWLKPHRNTERLVTFFVTNFELYHNGAVYARIRLTIQRRHPTEHADFGHPPKFALHSARHRCRHRNSIRLAIHHTHEQQRDLAIYTLHRRTTSSSASATSPPHRCATLARPGPLPRSAGPGNAFFERSSAGLSTAQRTATTSWLRRLACFCKSKQCTCCGRVFRSHIP